MFDIVWVPAITITMPLIFKWAVINAYGWAGMWQGCGLNQKTCFMCG